MNPDPDPTLRPRGRALFVSPGEGRGSEWMTIKADAARTAGALGLVAGTIPHGYSPQLHVHRDEDEAFYVLDGVVDFVCDGDRFRGEPGAFVYLPRGLAHTFIGISAEPAHVLMLLLPGGLENVLAAIDPATAPGGLARHHVEVVGPALSA